MLTLPPGVTRLLLVLWSDSLIGATPVCPFQESETLMRYPSTYLAGAALVLGVCLGVAGCAPPPPEAPVAAPIPVAVSYTVEREVTDYADYTARPAAVDSVEV